MKLSLKEMILPFLLLTASTSAFIVKFINLHLYVFMITIVTILLFISSMTAFIKNPKLINLTYPLLAIYFLVVMPAIGSNIRNNALYIGISIISFIISIILIYYCLLSNIKNKS